jgi:predicted ATP-grasp superfamily ATP-dependent carboligase
MRHDPIVQAFVPKDGEYIVGALCEHGDVVASFQHRQIRGNAYTGGGGVYRRSMYDPALERVARDLLAELEFHGLACIEYMRHADTGEYVLTEVNPRVWQSLPSTVHAGADFPWYYWLAATGRRLRGPRGGFSRRVARNRASITCARTTRARFSRACGRWCRDRVHGPPARSVVVIRSRRRSSMVPSNEW